MSIKVLFVILVLSAVAVIGAAVAAFFRVWWHLKSRQGGSVVPQRGTWPKDLPQPPGL